MSISTKWPAARLRGPDVSVEHALEYIRRTDRFLIGGGFTNNRRFESDYRALAGLSADKYSIGEYKREMKFADAFGHVELEHLGSHWVASSSMGGPDGPVSPSGRVILAHNFGKWPSTEEIESDLKIIAAEFPWLTFDLSVWGNSEEGDEGLPSDTWHLEGGKWESVEPKVLQVSKPDVVMAFMRSIASGAFNARETTWSVDQIRTMWGDKIAAAAAVANSEPVT